jgi:hypothetical protein
MWASHPTVCHSVNMQTVIPAERLIARNQFVIKIARETCMLYHGTAPKARHLGSGKNSKHGEIVCSLLIAVSD